VLPFTFAALLTVAAGFSLAEEHAWGPAAGPAVAPASVTSSDQSGQRAKGAMPVLDRSALDRAVSGFHADPAESDNRKASTRQPGVGSRALTGHDEATPAASRRPNAHPITDPISDLDEGSQSLD
jgi:hypothetical protein